MKSIITLTHLKNDDIVVDVSEIHLVNCIPAPDRNSYYLTLLFLLYLAYYNVQRAAPVFSGSGGDQSCKKKCQTE